MKYNRKNNIFGWLAASALLLTTACSDNDTLALSQGGVNDPKVVTFTIQPQQQTRSTRAEGDLAHISDGTKADALIFAVYEVNEDGSLVSENPLTEFAKGSQVEGLTVAEGQNAIKVDKYPVTIQFSIVDPSKKYKVAFWAQNSTTEAYDTRDLQKVEVKYDNAKNNDELRDAFCAVSNVIDYYSRGEEVTLRRPLAQINVGTTGWDYEGAAKLKPNPTSYTQSQITLKGVAKYYNILQGKSLGDDDLASGDPADGDGTDEATTDVTFEYATIPAFINATDDDWENLGYEPIANEEYLKVDITKDGVLAPYVGWDAYDAFRTNQSNLYDSGLQLGTETFKYLSMCYVLVPEATSLPAEGQDDHIDDVDNGAVLPSVTFETKGRETDQSTTDAPATADAEDNQASTDKKPLEKVFEIQNVPVQKNWRTNILGSDFFTAKETFKLDIVKDYYGEYDDYGKTEGNWPTDEGNETQGKTYSMYPKSNQTTTDYTESLFTITSMQYTNKPSGVTWKYNSTEYTRAFKIAGATKIKFTTESSISTVTIVQASNTGDDRGKAGIKLSTIKENGKEIPNAEYNYKSDEVDNEPANSENVRVYTIDVPAGEHTIERGNYYETETETTDESKIGTAKQAYILYIEVKTEDSYEFGDNNPTEKKDDEFDEKYPDYNPKDNPDTDSDADSDAGSEENGNQ